MLVRPKPEPCEMFCFFNTEVRYGLAIGWHLENPWTRVDHYRDMGRGRKKYQMTSWEITDKNGKISWACSECYVQIILLGKLKMGKL